MTDRQTRATCWSITINNPTQSDEDWIQQARQKGWQVSGQKEKGLEGTEHQQLMVKTPQVRFSAVKKLFPRGHIEIARNPAALATYVSKEETRVGQLPDKQELYPSQAKTFSMFAGYVLDGRDGKGGYISWTPEKWHREWEEFVERKITEGYQIEQIAVNPQTIAIVKRYGRALVDRHINQVAAKNNVAEEHNHGLSSSCDEEEDAAEASSVRADPPQGGSPTVSGLQ